ncbi:tail assembly protein [Salmonella enterica subsp. enterica]|nr:tail assembly protein [Salmonella enterica subsp. enterica]EDP8717554.1 tail assembly protein [Salmonella enterica subsp. enterica]
MATPHTLDMATQGMARVCLHGDLQRFGRRFDLAVKNAAEALHALYTQIPSLRVKIQHGWYQVRICGRDVSEDTFCAMLHESLPGGAVVHIIPRTEGAKNGGIFQVIAGAALAVVGYALGWTGIGAIVGSIGVSMMLGGVAQMLAPKAKVPGSKQTDNGKQNTYFSSLENMAAQGNAMPVPYGEILVGSRTISQEISTRDEGGGGQVVVIGR